MTRTEEAAGLYLDNHKPLTRYNWGDLQDAFIAGAEWQKEQELAEMAQSKSPLSVAYANRFFENGKQAMKEQMMKEAVEGFIFQSEDYYPKELVAQYNGELKHGDKVKIIIVKQDDISRD